MNEIKDFIASVVNESTGVKATELISECMSSYPKVDDLLNCNLVEAIEELVVEGRILEVEYVVPHMDYRIKSLYLPIGSEVRVVVPE